MDTGLIVAIVAAFLIVDAFVVFKVLGGARRRAAESRVQGDPGANYSSGGLSDDWTTRQALAGSVAVAGAGNAAEEFAPSTSAPPPPPPAPPEPATGGAASYESGFENPGAGHPGSSEDAGWSLGGGWSDTSPSPSDSGSSSSSDSGGSPDPGAGPSSSD